MVSSQSGSSRLAVASMTASRALTTGRWCDWMRRYSTGHDASGLGAVVYLHLDTAQLAKYAYGLVTDGKKLGFGLSILAVCVAGSLRGIPIFFADRLRPRDEVVDFMDRVTGSKWVSDGSIDELGLLRRQARSASTQNRGRPTALGLLAGFTPSTFGGASGTRTYMITTSRIPQATIEKAERPGGLRRRGICACYSQPPNERCASSDRGRAIASRRKPQLILRSFHDRRTHDDLIQLTLPTAKVAHCGRRTTCAKYVDCTRRNGRRR